MDTEFELIERDKTAAVFGIIGNCLRLTGNLISANESQ